MTIEINGMAHVIPTVSRFGVARAERAGQRGATRAAAHRAGFSCHLSRNQIPTKLSDMLRPLRQK
jgi:hypothetical protein